MSLFSCGKAGARNFWIFPACFRCRTFLITSRAVTAQRTPCVLLHHRGSVANAYLADVGRVAGGRPGLALADTLSEEFLGWVCLSWVELDRFILCRLQFGLAKTRTS